MNDNPFDSPDQNSGGDAQANDAADFSQAAENARDPSAAEARQSARVAFDDLVRSAKEAFQAGARDATKAAKTAVPRACEGFNKSLHDLAYGVAYGLAFGTTLAREITPGPIRDGFSSGRAAGAEAADNFAEKRHEASARRKSRVAPDDDDPADVGNPTHGGFGEGEQPDGPVFV